MQLYRQAFDSFATFCQALGYSVNHACTEQVAEYIAWLSLQNKASSTISAYVAGISFWFKMRSAEDPTNSFLVTKMISALRREKPVQDIRQPISANILLKLVDVLQFITKSQYETTLYKAAFVMAYFGFLRLSEFTSESARRPATGLQSSDVAVLRTGRQNTPCVRITLRRSKNNQYGRSQTIYVKGSPTNSLCPVTAVEEYMSVRPGMARAFFTHFNNSPVTRHQFQAILKKATQAVGLQSQHFTSHSFRIGAATAASYAGFSSEQIQTAGRWRSVAYLRYIRQPGVIAAAKLV